MKVRIFGRCFYAFLAGVDSPIIQGGSIFTYTHAMLFVQFRSSSCDQAVN